MNGRYKCAHCEEYFSGAPALKNACGVFCAECKSKMMKGLKGPNTFFMGTPKGVCVWCGGPVDSPDKQRVCRKCDRNREWLLRCIRNGSYPARYVARVEKREALERAKREENKAEKRTAVPTSAPDQSNVVEHRLIRIENSMATLAPVLERLLKLADEFEV